jgi:hypothetical protein
MLTRLDSSRVAHLNRRLHRHSRGVDQGHQADQAETIRWEVHRLGVRVKDVANWEVLFRKFEVGKCKDALPSLPKRGVQRLQLLFHLFVHGHLLALGVNRRTLVDDPLGRPFHHEDAWQRVLVGPFVLVDRKHPFVRGVERNSRATLTRRAVVFNCPDRLHKLNDCALAGVALK